MLFLLLSVGSPRIPVGVATVTLVAMAPVALVASVALVAALTPVAPVTTIRAGFLRGTARGFFLDAPLRLGGDVLRRDYLSFRVGDADATWLFELPLPVFLFLPLGRSLDLRTCHCLTV